MPKNFDYLRSPLQKLLKKKTPGRREPRKEKNQSHLSPKRVNQRSFSLGERPSWSKPQGRKPQQPIEKSEVAPLPPGRKPRKDNSKPNQDDWSKYQQKIENTPPIHKYGSIRQRRRETTGKRAAAQRRSANNVHYRATSAAVLKTGKGGVTTTSSIEKALRKQREQTIS